MASSESEGSITNLDTAEDSIPTEKLKEAIILSKHAPPLPMGVQLECIEVVGQPIEFYGEAEISRSIGSDTDILRAMVEECWKAGFPVLFLPDKDSFSPLRSPSREKFKANVTWSTPNRKTRACLFPGQQHEINMPLMSYFELASCQVQQMTFSDTSPLELLAKIALENEVLTAENDALPSPQKSMECGFDPPTQDNNVSANALLNFTDENKVLTAENDALPLTQDSSVSPSGPVHLKFTNLPFGIWDDELKAFIVQTLHDFGCPFDPKFVLSCEIDSTFTGANVSFSDGKIAKDVLRLNEKEWQGQEMRVTIMKENEYRKKKTYDISQLVKVSELPFGLSDGEFKDMVVEAFSSKGVSLLPHQLQCSMDNTFTSGYVKFFSPHHIGTALELNGADMLGNAISVTIASVDETSKSCAISTKLKISNLYFGICEEEFKDIIREMLRRNGIIALDSDFEVNINTDFTSGDVLFKAEASAQAAYSCNGMEVNGCILKISEVVSDTCKDVKENMSEEDYGANEIHIHSDGDDADFSNFSTNQQMKTPCENDKFEDDHHLNSSLKNDVFLNNDPSSGSKATLENDNKCMKILVENLPAGLSDEDVKATIIFCLMSKKLGNASDVNLCYMLTSNSAVVEFHSYSTAKNFVSVKCVEAYGKILKMKFLNSDYVDDDAMFISDDEEATDANDRNYDLVHQSNTSSEAEEEKPTQQMSTLQTDFDTMAFALLFGEHRLKRPNAKLNTLYSLVVGDLETKFGIVTNMQLCKDRKKNLDDLFRLKRKMYGRKVIEWSLFCVVARMRKEDVTCLTAGHTASECPSTLDKIVRVPSITVACTFEEESAKCKKKNKSDGEAYFSQGAFVSKAASKALIHTIIDHGHKFDQLGRNSVVWNKIKKEMDKLGHNYEVAALVKEFGELNGRYKNYKALLSHTGQGAIEWDLYDEMEQLMSGNVSVEPLLTVSLGSSSQMVAREGLNGSSADRIGKSRPPSDPKKSWPNHTLKSDCKGQE